MNCFLQITVTGVLWDGIQEYYRRDDRLTRVVLNRNAANYNSFIK